MDFKVRQDSRLLLQLMIFISQYIFEGLTEYMEGAISKKVKFTVICFHLNLTTIVYAFNADYLFFSFDILHCLFIAL